MRRAPAGARGSDGARGGVDLIHASLSSAEKVDIARARGDPRSVAGCSALYFRPVGAPSSRRRNESNEVSEHATFYCCGKGSIELNNG